MCDWSSDRPLFFHKSSEIGAWVLISTVMVLAPDRAEAVKFALNRIKANLIGASVGLILAIIHPVNVYMIALGVVLAAVFCELLNLKTAMRSATVGVILISLAPTGKYFYEVAFDRAAGVVGGCIIAILLTVLMHTLLIKLYNPDQRTQAATSIETSEVI